MQVDHSGPQRESRVLPAFPKILCQDLLTDPYETDPYRDTLVGAALHWVL